MKDGHFVAAVWVLMNQDKVVSRGQTWERVDEVRGVFTHAEDLGIQTFQRLRFPWLNVKSYRADAYVSVYEVGVGEDVIGEAYLMTAVGHPMYETNVDYPDITFLSPDQ